MKKKLFAVILGTVLAAGLVAGCGSKPADETPAEDANKQETPADDAQAEGDQDKIVLKVGASPTPHGEILGAAKEVLAAEGIDLQIVEFNDYIQPNLALEGGDLDANYFQHKPYLDQFNEENKTSLVDIGNIHYEPMGIYAGKTTDLASLPDGAKVAVPNDGTNEARALYLLETNGLIKVNHEKGFTATKLDVTENPKNLEIVEMEAAQIPRSLGDMDISVINGNYALQAGFNVEKDALAKEEKDSEAAQTYPNIVAIRAGEEERPELQKLIEALHSQEVKDFIADTYKGAVVSLDE